MINQLFTQRLSQILSRKKVQQEVLEAQRIAEMERRRQQEETEKLRGEQTIANLNLRLVQPASSYLQTLKDLGCEEVLTELRDFIQQERMYPHVELQEWVRVHRPRSDYDHEGIETHRLIGDHDHINGPGYTYIHPPPEVYVTSDWDSDRRDVSSTKIRLSITPNTRIVRVYTRHHYQEMLGRPDGPYIREPLGKTIGVEAEVFDKGSKRQLRIYGSDVTLKRKGFDESFYEQRLSEVVEGPISEWDRDGIEREIGNAFQWVVNK